MLRSRLSTLRSTKIGFRTLTHNLAVLLSFLIPILMLYLSHPSTFEFFWKARAPYLVFLWLFILELALAWKKLTLHVSKSFRTTKTVITVITMAIPTVYVVATSFFGLTSIIIDLGKFVGVPYERYGVGFLTEHWTMSFEYLLFATLFIATVLLIYNVEGLKKFLVASFFLSATAFFYMLDTFYPYGTITLLQAFVPFTATSSASILNIMGYKTWVMNTYNSLRGPGTILVAIGQFSSKKTYFSVTIYWPSAGIHSMLIYTVTILLFLKNSAFTTKSDVVRRAVHKGFEALTESRHMSFLTQHKTFKDAANKIEEHLVNLLRYTPTYVIFAIGALGTFMANVLRIAIISSIGLHVGFSAVQHFHDYLGELFFIAWMLIFFVALFLAPKLSLKLSRLKKKSSSPSVKSV